MEHIAGEKTFFDQIMDGLSGSFKHQTESVKKDQRHDRTGIIANTVGQHYMSMKGGLLSSGEFDSILHKFNEISQWGVTQEEIEKLINRRQGFD